MKAYFFVILLGALAMYNCEECEGTGSSLKDCKQRDIPEGAYLCCFAEFKITVMGMTQEGQQCGSLTKEQYDNLDRYMEDTRRQIESLGGKIDKYEIDCNSNYIIISMLSLLLLFLL